MPRSAVREEKQPRMPNRGLQPSLCPPNTPILSHLTSSHHIFISVFASRPALLPSSPGDLLEPLRLGVPPPIFALKRQYLLQFVLEQSRQGSAFAAVDPLASVDSFFGEVFGLDFTVVKAEGPADRGGEPDLLVGRLLVDDIGAMGWVG